MALAVAMTITSMGSGLTKRVNASDQVSYANDLFISEYVEGSSNNKAIEIFNGTGSTVDLSQYKIMKDSNGNGAFGSIYQLTGELAHGQTVVIANSRAEQSILDIATTGNMNFNGDDQVALYKNDVEIDHIGIPGDVDFGKDVTFVRHESVKQGTVGDSDPRNNDGWVAYPKNTFSNLGSHTVSYGSTKVANVVASHASGEVANGTMVAFTCVTEGATIQYALDGQTFVDYTSPIAITEDTTVTAKAVKEGLEESDVQTFTYTIRAAQEVTTLADARANYVDEDNNYLDDKGQITVEGTVTAVNASGYTFLTDGTASIGVKFQESTNVVVGDQLRIVGTVGSSYGFAYLKVDYASDVTVTGHQVIAPETVALADIGEAKEGGYIRVENVTIASGPQYGEYVVEGGNEKFRLKPSDQDWLEVGKTYESITGVVYYGYGKYALITQDELDIVEDSSKVRTVQASLESSIVPVGTELTLTTHTTGATIYFTTDGTEPSEASTRYTGPITIDQDMELRAVAVREGLTNSHVLALTFTVAEVVGNKTISEIQGESHTSPYNNKDVESVEGIVTALLNYKFDFIGGKRIIGFYMQAENGDGNDATSDAIFVKTTTPVTVGDKVTVDGRVSEYVKDMDFFAYSKENQLSVTSIEASGVTVVSSGNPLPEAVILGENGRVVPHDEVSSANFSEYNVDKYAIDFYESVEGMRIKIENPLVVAPEHNRVLSVVADNGVIAKKDGDLANFGGIILQEKDVNTEIMGLNGAITSLGNIKSVAPGATSTEAIEGVLDYEWGTYQVYITQPLPAFTNVERPVDTLKFELNEDELTIASYNVYNHGGDDNAKSLAKATGIADAIVNGMKSPDIVGLLEVQDNDGKNKSDVVDASEVYQTFIDEIVKLGGPEYAWTDIAPVDDKEGGEPGGNIRVGYLYNPARVQLKEGANKGGSTETVGVDKEGHLTLNPGRIAATASAFNSTRKSLAAEFVFQGKEVIVIANHLSSKGGDDGTYGNVQPAVKHSEVDRTAQAQLINDFIDDVLAVNPKANIVALGDLNDFQFSTPVRTLSGQGDEQVLVNMIDRLPLSEQYTYNFGGNSQVLDNILVSNHLADDTRVDVLNINSIISDEDKARRHSDHDPVVVSMKLKEKEEPRTVKDISITGMKLMKLGEDKDTRVFNRRDMIHLAGAFQANYDDVKNAMVEVKIMRIAKSGREMLVAWNRMQGLSINDKEVALDFAFETRSMARGNYKVYFDVYNTTGDSKLCDTAVSEFYFTNRFSYKK